MASQILHDLIDELENAAAPVLHLVPAAEARIRTAITALRAHAEADAGQLLADAKVAGTTLVGQAVADAAPIVADLKADATDLAHTAEAGVADVTAGEPQPTDENGNPIPTPETAA